jgi:hypothetical protein
MPTNPRIKVTSKRLPRIRVTSPKLERIEPASVAQALSAELVESGLPEVVIPNGSRLKSKNGSVNGTH